MGGWMRSRFGFFGVVAALVVAWVSLTAVPGLAGVPKVILGEDFGHEL